LNVLFAIFVTLAVFHAAMFELNRVAPENTVGVECMVEPTKKVKEEEEEENNR
jgi:hypothetical protein